MPFSHQLSKPEYALIPGTLAEAQAAIKRSVGQHLRSHFHVKVGITNNPERRWNSHKADGWEKMVVIYKSRCRSDYARLDDVRTLECSIEEHIRSHTYSRSVSYNSRAGGAGRPGSGDQFVYLLLSSAWRKRAPRNVD